MWPVSRLFVILGAGMDSIVVNAIVAAVIDGSHRAFAGNPRMLQLSIT